jgi:hypothetical protein
MAVVAPPGMGTENPADRIAPQMKLPAEFTNRPPFVMHQDQGLFELLTVADKVHEPALKTFSTSSAESIAPSMREDRPLLCSGLHF